MENTKNIILFCDNHNKPLKVIKTEDGHNCFICEDCNKERSRKS